MCSAPTAKKKPVSGWLFYAWFDSHPIDGKQLIAHLQPGPLRRRSGRDSYQANGVVDAKHFLCRHPVFGFMLMQVADLNSDVTAPVVDAQ